MKNALLTFGSAAAILLGLSTQLAGCACEQQTQEDGSTLTVCEPITIYEGEPVTDTLLYAPGKGLEADIANGSLTVRVGGGDEVSVTWRPKTGHGRGEEDLARQEMEEGLTFTLEERGDMIYVQSAVAAGKSPYLGADVEITLPSGFAGAVDIFKENAGDVDADLRGSTPTSTRVSANGSLRVLGAQGTLDIAQTAGLSCEVSVTGWSANSGKIACDDAADITIASGLGGILTAVSQRGVVNDPSPFPSDWVAAEGNVENSKTFSFGDSTGAGTVAVTSDEDVNLSVN
ncbi:MAG: hypothetical protein KC731_00040 [Myxococcales bacterium]|nr:hypothetical protein [Myxococcales bacterium]